MTYEDIANDYFEWLVEYVYKNRRMRPAPYMKLFTRLHEREFYFSIPMDDNRAADGESLRYRYAIFNGYEESYKTIVRYLDGPCSILEMMVALALRCEETIMDDPKYGDRTEQWFWTMITSLGLGRMIDTRFDIAYVDEKLDTFLNHEYEPDGHGGLFTVRNCDRDLRTMEIWQQLNYYLNSIT